MIVSTIHATLAAALDQRTDDELAQIAYRRKHRATLPENKTAPEQPERMCGMKVEKDGVQYEAWPVQELIEQFAEWDGLPDRIKKAYMDAKIFIMAQHVDVETEKAGWLRAVVGDYLLSGPDGLEPVGAKELEQFYK